MDEKELTNEDIEAIFQEIVSEYIKEPGEEQMSDNILVLFLALIPAFLYCGDPDIHDAIVSQIHCEEDKDA